ncbi:PepSY-like domain-containing protein [Rufibacter soli]|jgi:hypothetical protein
MKTMYVTLLVAASTLWGCSQKVTASNLPSLVKSSLQTKFPAATAIEWEKEGQAYEAEFLLGQVEYTALLDSTGQILATKQDLTAADLPETVSQALKRDFQAYLVEDVEKVERNGQVFYQVELEKQTEELKKVYDANGTASEVPYWD